MHVLIHTALFCRFCCWILPIKYILWTKCRQSAPNPHTNRITGHVWKGLDIESAKSIILPLGTAGKHLMKITIFFPCITLLVSAVLFWNKPNLIFFFFCFPIREREKLWLCVFLSAETGSYICEFCGKQYKYFNPYQEHVALHTPISEPVSTYGTNACLFHTCLSFN